MRKHVLIAVSAILLGTSCATTSVVNDPLPSYSRFSTSHSFIHGKADMTSFKHFSGFPCGGNFPPHTVSLTVEG